MPDNNESDIFQKYAVLGIPDGAKDIGDDELTFTPMSEVIQIPASQIPEEVPEKDVNYKSNKVFDDLF